MRPIRHPIVFAACVGLWAQCGGGGPVGSGPHGGGGQIAGAAGEQQGGAGGAQSGGSGGAPPAAGGHDGGAADAAEPGDARAALACAGRLVCDDFEKATTGGKPAAPFAVHAAHGTVTIDETRAWSGTHAVKVAIDATTASDTYREAYLAVTAAPLIPLPENKVYGRFMIYTDRIPDKTVHWTIAHADGPIDNLAATYNYGGMGNLMANYYRNTSPDPNDCWQTKNVSFPTGRWVCVAFAYDGPGNDMRFWMDGAEVPELHVVGLNKTDMTCTVKGVDGRWLAPTFKNVSVGWESYQHDVAGAHVAWIDDVVLDAQPIACP